MYAGRRRRAPSRPSRWLGVEDVFATVASYLPVFELAPLAASSSLACEAVYNVAVKHSDAIGELDECGGDLHQQMKDFIEVLKANADTADRMMQDEPPLAKALFRVTVCRYAAALHEFNDSFYREYILPSALYQVKVVEFLAAMAKVQRARSVRIRTEAELLREAQCDRTDRRLHAAGGSGEPAAAPAAAAAGAPGAQQRTGHKRQEAEPPAGPPPAKCHR
eukprot:TRINITY_DN23604_c0_g1_i1.p1 TRINITY_DN23604_c0_g1~~TRINITY_DN23604_c0_g1_i1.p1  ORF type:complete len:248 (+),score=65.07 TRINITY_DN23604_c0_g1_i1:83-745(+)